MHTLFLGAAGALAASLLQRRPQLVGVLLMVWLVVRMLVLVWVLLVLWVHVWMVVDIVACSHAVAAVSCRQDSAKGMPLTAKAGEL